jgi:uncharacterized membrane protein
MSDAVPPTMGNRLAPPRFIAFVLLLVVGVPAGHFWLNDWPRGLMAGFDVAALVFLVSCLPLIRVQEGAVMRDHALSNDARRVVLLVLTGIVMAAILAAVTKLVASGGSALPSEDKVWIIATLLLAWLFSNSVYGAPLRPPCLHGRVRQRAEGLEFPGTREPTYADFAYFAFTLGTDLPDVGRDDPRRRHSPNRHLPLSRRLHLQHRRARLHHQRDRGLERFKLGKRLRALTCRD